MPISSEQEIALQKQRRERLFQAFGRFIGFLSALVIVVSLGLTIYRKIQNRPQLEWDYVQKVYGTDGHGLPAGSSSESGQSGERGGHRDMVDFSGPGKGVEHGPARLDVVDMSVPRGLSGEGAVAASKAGGIKDIEGKQQAIADVVREFFSAGTITELLPLVRDARRVRPLMETYYATHPMKSLTWKGVGWAMPVEEPGYRFAYVQALFEDSTPVHVVVEETDVGFLVDWESSVHYSEVGWKDFQISKPEQPKTFRLLASKPDDADNALAGTSQGGLLKLKHPAEDGVVYGRFDPGDPRFRPLVEQLDLCQWKDVPVILRLCYPGPSTPSDQVEIAGVEGKGWLILGRTRG